MPRPKLRQEEPKVCEVCNKLIYKETSCGYKQFEKRRYCSKLCESVGKKNKVPWNKGIKMWEGKIHPLKGKNYTMPQATKDKISKTKRENPFVHTKEMRKKMSEKLKKFIFDEEKIRELYINKELNSREIANIYGCSIGTILNFLGEKNIPRRHKRTDREKENFRIIGKNRFEENPKLRLQMKRFSDMAINNPLTRKRMSEAKKGKSYEEIYGVKKGIKKRLKIKEIWNNPSKILFAKKRRAKQILPTKDSSIEVKIQNFLKKLGIEFFTHQYMKDIEHGYQCDIFIPSMNLVVECDGNYWHKYPVGRGIDHIRTKELIEKGFGVLRLWGSEIKMLNLRQFKSIIKIYKSGRTPIIR